MTPRRLPIDEWFWHYDFRFDLRNASRGEQEAVRTLFLAQRLELAGFSERHVDLVELVLGHASAAREGVKRGHAEYDEESAAMLEP